MKKILFICLFVLLNFNSYSQETIKDIHTKDSIFTIDDFVDLFYHTQEKPEKLIPFFDITYLESKNKFVEHLILKYEKCGMFVEKRLKSKRISPNRNIISLKYRVKYQKKSTNDKILVKRNSKTNHYEIFYWRTR